MSQNYQDKINDSSCHFCARQREIQAHHIVPQRFNGRDTRENLVGVCERCHKKLERLYDKRFYEQLGIPDEKGKRKFHFQCLRCNDQKPDAAIQTKAGNIEHFCIDCATELLEEPGWYLVEDFTGGRLIHRAKIVGHERALDHSSIEV